MGETTGMNVVLVSVYREAGAGGRFAGWARITLRMTATGYGLGLQAVRALTKSIPRLPQVPP